MKKIKNILAFIILGAYLTGCSDINFIGASIPKVNSGINASSYSTLDNKSFILKHSYKLDPQVAENIAGYVNYYSKINNVDSKLVLSLMAKESSFRANAISSAGAIGLGQLMEGTAKDMGVTDRYDAEENTKGTIKYISWLLKRTNGDVDKALASYNMGPGAVERISKSGGELPSSVKKYVSDIKSYFEA
ncbi:MAG: lytic transglycosylase domain-containing protein [Candidatus Sericytochromatia bacterium]|nr:lytic transglycosylase domain-containing protein [Candidatus Sericytochromatia bacterium]